MSRHQAHLQTGRVRAIRCLCWVRFLVLLAVMILSAGGLYLNQVGLPESLRARLEFALRERGLDCKIGQIWLRGFRTFATEDLHLNATGDANSVRAVVREAEFRIGLSSLLRFQVVPRSLTVRQGTIGFPVIDKDGRSSPLSVEKITSKIEFLANDRWELTDFQGEVTGIQVQVSGTIDHASEIGVSTDPLTRTQTGLERNRQFQDVLESFRKIDFAPSSSLTIQFRGDARDMRSLEAKVEIQASHAAASWGNLKNVQGNVDIAPARDESKSPQLKAELAFGEIQTKFGMLDGVAFHGQMNLDDSGVRFDRCDWSINLKRASWDQGGMQDVEVAGTTSTSSNGAFWGVTHVAFSATAIDTLGFRLQDYQLDSELFHSRTNHAAFSGDWRFQGGQITSKYGQSEGVDLSGKLSSSEVSSWKDVLAKSDEWPDAIKSTLFDWSGKIKRVKASDVDLGDFEWTGQWDVQEVSVDFVNIVENEGRLDVSARFNPETREIIAEIRSSIDGQRISPLLPPNGERWLRQFAWDAPPLIAATANLTIPSEMPAGLTWQESLLQGLKLSGDFAIDRGSFRDVSFDAARSDFTFSNLSWHLPSLTVTRSEGESKIQYWMNSKTRDFLWSINGLINPKALKPIFDEPEQGTLDLFEFTEPLQFEGEIEGRWRERQRLKGQIQLSSENFFFKGEKCDAFSAMANVKYPVVSLTNVALICEHGRITAKEVVVDPIEKTMSVTDGVSTMDPDLVTRVIGPKTHRVLQPYQFGVPPTVLVNGLIPIGKVAEKKADAHFDITGQSFHYWKFNLPQVSGQLKWLGKSISITNLNAGFYGGNLAWDGYFDFSVPDGADFEFRGNVTGSNLQSLMSDLTATNSSMEGSLNGNLVVTSANSVDWDSWNGYGDATVRDGYLWSIPIVGVFAPVLDKFVPGLGSSRASAASGTFNIEDSVVRTSNFAVRSPALRLRYDGSVDFDGGVDAQMQAEILRDVWAVGRMVSMVFWPITKVFEFRVTGTLEEPKSVPRFAPKALLWPFQPLKTIKEILIPENAPPILTPLPNRENSGP